MGRYHIVRGVAAATSGILPAVTMDECDRTLASIAAPGAAPVIRHDINPAYLAANADYSLYGNDRARGRIVSAQRATVGKIEAEPLFKNFPAIDCMDSAGDGGSDLTMDDFWRDNSSWTFMVVATIDPVLKASPRTARLLSVITQSPVATKVALGMTPDGHLGMGGFGGLAFIPVENVPAANVPFVLWGQYSFSDNLFQIGINNSTIVDTDDPTSAVDFTSGDRIGIGSATNATSSDVSWHGKIARAVTFSSRVTTSYLTNAVEALQNKYIA